MEQKIADRIREYREAKGWTQDDLAAAAEMNRVTIAKYESGRIEPKSKSLSKLATALGVSTDVLLGNDGTDATDDEREMWELREAARRDPDRKVLLKLAKNGTAQDVRQAVALIDALRATNPAFYDGDDPA